MLQARPGTSGKQQQQQNSLNLGAPFKPIPVLTRRKGEGEIVDGLIAGQKRQWSGGERKEWLRELEMRTRTASLSLSALDDGQ